MNDEILNEIINCLKILKSNSLNIPENRKQAYTKFMNNHDEEDIYKLLVNRKGRVRENPLSYTFFSEKLGRMIRLDMTGSPHEDIHENLIETPHVHIFDETHNDGKIVEPLSYITDEVLIHELRDSLIAILLFCNVDIANIQIPIT